VRACEAKDGAGRATQDAKAEMQVLRICREQKLCHGTAALRACEAKDGAGRATQDAKAEMQVLRICLEQKS